MRCDFAIVRATGLILLCCASGDFKAAGGFGAIRPQLSRSLRATWAAGLLMLAIRVVFTKPVAVLTKRARGAQIEG
jgi:hypothetical protein